MTEDRLNEILKKHALWLDNQEGGQRANLQGANLRQANLQGADLRQANLRQANLQGADLRWANLRQANLQGTNLQGTDLRWANLREANLQGTDLREADLQGADLQGADLQGADLQGANIDLSSLPLWCGGLHLQLDDKQIIQVLYHLLSAAEASKNISQDLKKFLLTPELITAANKFHRVGECGQVGDCNETD